MRNRASLRSHPSTRRLGGWLAAVAYAAVSLGTQSVRAAPPEFLSDLVLHPSDPSVLVLRYESVGGGFLISRDGGKTFRADPGRAFYMYDLRDRIPIQMSSDGKLLIGLGDGFLADDGKGCGVASEPSLVQAWVADLAAHPGDPSTTFLVTTGDTHGKHAGLWKRDQRGALTALGRDDQVLSGKLDFVVSGLRIVSRAGSMEGLRFIEVGTKYEGAAGSQTSAPQLRISDDLGASWVASPIPDTAATAGVPRLLAVEAGEPFKVVVALEVRGAEPEPVDPILLSVDGGHTFTPYLDQIHVAGVAAQLPGGRLLLADGGSPGGLWSADTLGAPLTKIADFPVRCLGYQPDDKKLYLCNRYELGLFDLAARSFCGIFQMSDAAGFVDCPAAPLAQNQAVVDRLCDGWCGPGHYASSPLCYAFQAGNKTCGAAALAFDRQGTEPDKWWIEPPGSGAAPRCTGFERSSPDAGVPALDAGAPAADAGEPVLDAGPEPAAADAASALDAGSRTKSKKDGCQLSPGASAPPATLVLLGLALVAIRSARRRSA